MYRILHKLFGWDYIAWHNTADQGTARVFIAGDGEAYYWRYKTTRLADRIKTKEQVIWLTCRPEKYLGKVKD